MPITKNCQQCSKEFSVIPAREKTAKFCSNKCRGAWRADRWVGKDSPRWRSDVSRSKECERCGEVFHHRHGRPLVSFQKRKFCSKVCAISGQKRLYGEDNPRWKPDARRKARKGKHGSWSRAVVSRDKATCQRCGVTGIEMHAHHIKSYSEFPDLRWNLDNGETLCCICHWNEHAVSNENAVNSGDTLTGGAEGNPEPSHGRKPVEGVTTRGRAYRRWNGNCAWCGTFISKRWSDTVGKKNLFCGRKCSALHNSNTREYCRPKNPRTPPRAVTSSTSAAPERDDIVWTCGKP